MNLLAWDLLVDDRVFLKGDLLVFLSEPFFIEASLFILLCENLLEFEVGVEFLRLSLVAELVMGFLGDWTARVFLRKLEVSTDFLAEEVLDCWAEAWDCETSGELVS